MRKKLNLTSLFFIVAITLLCATNSAAQISSGPRFYLDNNSVTAKDACVNQNTPNRSAIAKSTTTDFSSGAEFILELSDIDGNFIDNGTTVLSRFTSSVDISIGEDIDFSDPFPIPTNLASNNYSMRVRVVVNGMDDVFSLVTRNMRVYYFDTDNPITLTSTIEGASNVALCDGESSILTASPSDYPEYEWSFDGVIIADQTGPRITNVTRPGRYTVRINLGECEGFYGGTNIGNVTVIDFNPTTVRINEPSPQEFCPSDIRILSVSVNDPTFVYEWFKNGELVPELSGAIVNLDQSDFGGIYTVNVIGSSTCSITTEPVEVVNLGSSITAKPPPQLVVLPTETSIPLEIETNAPGPGSTVQWFRVSETLSIPLTNLLSVDDPGALSIVVTDPGLYLVQVNADDICMDTLEATVEVVTPVGFRAQIASLLDCDAETGTIGLETLFGIASNGAQIPITPEQYPLFDFEWFLGTQSTGITETNLTVTQDNVGEIYTLQVTLTGGAFGTETSNELAVELLSNDLNITASSTFIPFGESVTLTVPQSSSYIYEWFTIVNGENQSIIDGSDITGQGTNSIETRVSGDYFVRITLSDCVIDSNTITISDDTGGEVAELIPNLITPGGNSANNNWVLPERFREPDTEVIIYSPKGQVDFQKSGGYDQEWPSNSVSGANETLYFYIITKSNSVVKKGTITVMR